MSASEVLNDTLIDTIETAQNEYQIVLDNIRACDPKQEKTCATYYLSGQVDAMEYVLRLLRKNS